MTDYLLEIIARIVPAPWLMPMCLEKVSSKTHWDGIAGENKSSNQVNYCF